MHREPMDAVADFGLRVRDVLGAQALVDCTPRHAAIVGPERACGRDRDEDALRVVRIEKDCVKAQSASAGLPAGARPVAAQPGQFLPGLAAIGGLKERRVLHSRVNGVGIRERRLEVPDALELPRMRRAVIPLMGSRNAVVGKLVSDRCPGLAAVVRALHHLSEPAGALRCIEAVGIGRRSFDVINLPAGEMRTLDRPLFAFAVRAQDERAFSRSHQYAHSTHADPRSLCFIVAAGFDWPSTSAAACAASHSIVDRPVLQIDMGEKQYNRTIFAV